MLAGGCFWGVQGVFQHVAGVRTPSPATPAARQRRRSYRAVGSGATGHAEAVEVTFDPDAISYGEILQIFFSVAHDPTQLNRQGPDVGPQYRSAIFPQDDDAGADRRGLHRPARRGRRLSRAIVTTIEPGRAFYPAEDYHQDYLTLNPTQPYIVHNDLPKIGNLKRLFPEVYRDDPVLVSEAARAARPAG